MPDPTYEIWSTGHPAERKTPEETLAAARVLFPKARASQIARFVAGEMFMVMRVEGEKEAQKVVERLRAGGIPCSYTIAGLSTSYERK